MTSSRFRLSVRTLDVVALASLLAFFTLCGQSLAEAPYLLGDLVFESGGSADAFPAGWIEAGDRAYFHASHHLAGRELFVTDGTEQGTMLLADASPGDTSGSPEPYGELDGRLLWWAWTGESRSFQGDLGALWASDGTPEGTERISPLEIGILSPDAPLRGGAFAGGVLYFFGCSPEECALWSSDGTPAGTRWVHVLPAEVVVTEIDLASAGERVYYLAGESLWTYAPGSGATLLVSGEDRPRPPANLAVVGSTLFFSFDDSGDGDQLWKSDGTHAGTVPVSSLPGGDDVWAGHRTSGSELYFVVEGDGGEGLEIWKSDGSDEGTVPVTDFEYRGAIPRRFLSRDFLVVGNLVFVNARRDNQASGSTIWVSDGTPTSTRDIAGCSDGCRVASRITRVGDRVAFAVAFDDRLELWSSNGTIADTGPVATVCGAACSSDVIELHPVGSEVGFVAGGRAWVTDGTDSGTRAISPPGPPEVADFGGVGRLGDCWLFSGGDHRGFEPWCSEGTPESVRIVADTERGVPGSLPEEFVDAGQGTVFSARDTSGVRQVWSSDGRPGAVVPLTHSSIKAPRQLLGTGEFAIYNDITASSTLWRTDGTESGTFPLGVLERHQGFVYRDRIYVFGLMGETQGIWEIDSSAEGPRLAIPLSTVVGHLPNPTVLGDLFYFEGIEDGELWRSDGTPEGTFAVTSLPVDARLARPLAIASLDGIAYFVVDFPFDDDQVWRTDGTPQGTVLVGAIPPFLHHPFASHGGLIGHAGALWFAAENDDPGVSGRRPAIYRLTEVGLTAVARSREPEVAPWIAGLGDGLLFTFDDGVHGSEPWWSDGTEAGTKMLADLHRGGDASPSAFTATGESVYFAAGSNRYGRELWRADASGEVALVGDLAPGAASSDPQSLAVVAGKLYFAADDGETGREPWALVLDGSGPPDPPDVPLPPTGGYLTSPAVPGFRFKVRLSTPAGSRPGQAETSCIPETLCVSGALPGRSEIFLRIVGPKPNGQLWPTLVKFSTSRVEVWVEQTATGALRYYDLAGAAPGVDVLAGLFDRAGFDPVEFEGETTAERPAKSRSSASAHPSAAGQPLSSSVLPGFTFRVEIVGQQGQSVPVRVESDCIEETVCVSGAVPGRSELFLRIVGPKPNGKLWPTLVRFSTSTIDVWIVQESTGIERHYHLEGANPGSSDLSGLFDRGGFEP